MLALVYGDMKIGWKFAETYREYTTHACTCLWRYGSWVFSF